MNKILYVQPIFAPDENQMRRQLYSLHSLHEYLLKFPTKIEFCFGGWAKTNGKWEIIRKTIELLFGKQKIIRFTRNFGKATVVNQLIADYSYDYDYILTSDSDIKLLADQGHMFDRLISVAEQLSHKNFGLLSLNQTENCAHEKRLFINKMVLAVEYENRFYHEVIRWPKYPGGIAGGSLFISKKFWKYIGGYKILGVYAGDDARIFEDAYKYGYFGAMIDTISVEHPWDKDLEYQKWKGTVCQRDSKTGIKKTIEPIIIEAEEFWSNKNKNDVV